MLTGEPRTATCTSVGSCCCLIVSAEAWESVLGAYSVVLARGMRRRLLLQLLTLILNLTLALTLALTPTLARRLLQLLPVIRQITSGLSQSEEKRLLESFVEREYAPGEFIMQEGEAASSVFVVEKGEVAIWSGGNGRGDLGSEVARRGAAELLGEGVYALYVHAIYI